MLDAVGERLSTVAEHLDAARADVLAFTDSRRSYALTAAGEELLPVLAALHAWGKSHATADHPR